MTPHPSSGARRPTLRDVARVAGVHPATASRALNAHTRDVVHADTVRRVEDAARALDYRPDQLARSLKTGRSGTIGVVLPDLTNPVFPPIVRGIEDGLVPAGYVPLVGNTDTDEEREQLVLDRLQGRQVDGLIVATAKRHHPKLLEIAGAGVPVVLVNRVIDGNRLPSVSVNDASGILAVVDHLVALGHRRIAHVAGPQDLSTGFGRYVGYRSGLESAGLDTDPELVVFADSFSEAAGFRGATELLRRARPLSAIIAANDMLALGCLRALAGVGLSCPRDVSVVGFNDMPFVDRVSPALTTVRLPHYEVGTHAATLVLERIADPTGPVKALFLTPELVARDSTAPPPGLRRLGAGRTASTRRQSRGAAAGTLPAEDAD